VTSPPRIARGLAALVAVVTLVLATAFAGCVVVPQNRRYSVADPLLRYQTVGVDAPAHQKLSGSRAAAAGGAGTPAGGGCACQ